MAKIRVIQQGESLDFKFDRGGESITNWICTINVKQFPDDDSSITRVIPEDEDANSWDGYLTHTETSTLDIHLWELIGVLTNSVTDEQEVPVVRFNVTKAWA